MRNVAPGPALRAAWSCTRSPSTSDRTDASSRVSTASCCRSSPPTSATTSRTTSPRSTASSRGSVLVASSRIRWTTSAARWPSATIASRASPTRSSGGFAAASQFRHASASETLAASAAKVRSPLAFAMSKARRSSSRPSRTCWAQGETCVDHEPEPHLPCEREAVVDRAFHLGERMPSGGTTTLWSSLTTDDFPDVGVADTSTSRAPAMQPRAGRVPLACRTVGARVRFGSVEPACSAAGRHASCDSNRRRSQARCRRADRNRRKEKSS